MEKLGGRYSLHLLNFNNGLTAVGTPLPRPFLIPKQRLHVIGEIDAPVAPGVAALGVVHGVGDVAALEALAELVDAMMEKIAGAAADPVFRVAAVGNLLVTHHGREHAHGGKCSAVHVGEVGRLLRARR